MACGEPNGSCGCKKNEPLVGLNDTARETDDDVWADDDEAEYSMKDQSTADLKRTHTKQGYLDGLTQAQESGLQQGFDEAFPKGAQLGIEVGRILSRIWCYKDVRKDLFEQAKQELAITKILDRKYFDNDLESKGEHEIIARWKNILNELQNST